MNNTEFALCERCQKPMPKERQELGINTCIKCTPQPEKPLGVIEYAGKTGGVLVVCNSRKEFDFLKRPANRRR